MHRSLRAEFLSPELVSLYLVKLQEGLKEWIENGGVGSLLRARLSLREWPLESRQENWRVSEEKAFSNGFGYS